ncbi:MAG: hypothetical protein RL521_1443 [Bacteroidota bacterium]|jgi:regulatory protein
MSDTFPGFSKEWLKIKHYCDKAERCHRDVQLKLRSYEVPNEIAQNMVVELIGEKLLNEERYARAYAHDHHAFKSWGKQKIKQGLFRKGISKALIALAMQDIPDEDEQENMRILAKMKWESLAKDTIIKRKGKVMRYLFNKGFDAEQIQKAIRILAGADDE